jgi:hypothetical protein
MLSFRSGRLGFALIAVGALVDTAYHVLWAGDDQHAGVGLLGHLITLAGMVVTIAAVVAMGLRTSARQSLKGDPHARRSPSAS